MDVLGSGKPKIILFFRQKVDKSFPSISWTLASENWEALPLQGLTCAAEPLIPAHRSRVGGFTPPSTCEDVAKPAWFIVSCHSGSCSVGSSPGTRPRAGSTASVLFGFGGGEMGPACPASAECGFDSIRRIFLFCLRRRDGIVCQAGLCQIVANLMPPL